MRKFWLIWCENGFVPTVKHFTILAARQECERLARKHVGKKFVVLVAYEYMRAEIPMVTRYEMEER